MMPSIGFETVLASFLLALSSLFSIVNPVGSALMFAQITSDRSHTERAELSRRIGLYSALVMLAALWAGAPILNFFGVSLAALRIAGGLFVAAFAWTMLTAPEAREARKHAEAEPEAGENLAEVAFFPLTLPFTTGPGTIAVAIALGANRPSEPGDLAGFFLGASLAALAVAGVIRLAYGSAERVVTLIGSVRARVLGRLSAFLLLCVGTQITVSGVSDVLGPLIASQRV
ncbi:hypothetical protein ASF53_01380 [Methylobacterium sp. Leaf123]|uniref:MarC family protein n=1 Tax=Methylobacterium sp. Leaf123 TaxID=1736264 RepID=UPI0006FA5978|nr:MarC family protein [Methylobacterium sp. Leaf123]KQQ31387.1 hypothetical protein ASF53_01380 [Methylobacterium sp. Leaf123]